MVFAAAAADVQSEDVNDEVVDDAVTEMRCSSRRLYESSVYSESSVITSNYSLMTERVVRSPLHCGSAHQSH